MDIVNVDVVDRFARRHRDVAQRLEGWKDQVTNARWSTPHDAQREMSGVTPIGGRRLIFNIKGNQYRIVAVVNYVFGTVRVRFIGKHSEYDDIEAKEV